MKKMLNFILIIGSLIVFLWPVAARGQYVGGSRPWSNQRIADSLARKADTTMVRALEARHAADSLLKSDSLAAHAARIAAKPDSSKFKGFQKFYTAGTLDSLKPSATGSTTPDSFPFSYVIGRGTGGNENYSLADSSLLGLALDSAFTRLASTGGTIFIKGGTYAINKVDTLRSSTRTIAIKGEEGRTRIYLNISDYWIYDTLNVGKVWITGGIEFIGASNALGLIRTGNTPTTSGDSIVVRNNIIRLFNNTGATVFAQDTLTQAWLVEDNQIQNCTATQFKGYNCIIRSNDFTGGIFGIKTSFSNWILNNNITQADSVGVFAYIYRRGVNGYGKETPFMKDYWGLIIAENSITWRDSSNYIGIQVEGTHANDYCYSEGTYSICNNTIGRSLYWSYWCVPVFETGILVNTTYNFNSVLDNNRITGFRNYGIYFNTTSGGNSPGVSFHGNFVTGKLTGIYFTNSGGGSATHAVRFSDNFYRSCATALNIAAGKNCVVAGETVFSCTSGLSDSGTGTIKTIGADGTYTTN